LLQGHPFVSFLLFVIALSTCINFAWNHLILQDGAAALMMAADNGHSDCVRMLIDAGADKEAKSKVRIDRFVAARASVRFISPFRNCADHTH